MDLKLKNKKALVCAASKGLGRATAESLAQEGVDLFLCARGKESLEKTAQEIRERFAVTVFTKSVDLAIPSEISPFADHVQKTLGRVDILVNNIGGPPPSAAATTSQAEWQKGFEQIFLSAALLSQHFLAQMKKEKFGRILTLTSLSVVEPIDHLVVSTAMRAALTTFSKSLAKEVAADGITVNTVMPGVIHTARIEELRRAKAERSGSSLESEMQATRDSIPIGRLGNPEELADLVCFLASPKSAYITGMNFSVDGGLRKGW